MLRDAPVGSEVSVLVGASDGLSDGARPGDRFHHLFEERCDELRAAGREGQLAVDTGHVRLSYGDLDVRANQVAGHLAARGVRPGDRVGLLFDGSADSYASILAVSKLHAAYVPLDAGYPEDRLAFIVEDAAIGLVVTLSHLATRVESIGTPTVCLDSEADAIARQSPARHAPEHDETADTELCYIIYTSGSTGRPKGVAMDHAGICNFVRVAARAYGLQPGDRVYQGMTIAFDFSVEEIWVPLTAGATLVPRPPGPSLVGRDLWRYLMEQRVTALCCVPTLLATIDEDLPGLRFLLVSGEACPHDLVARWHRAERIILNVYGPTEAAVTATWTRLEPDGRVTIGVPLPTYAIVVLHETDDAVVPLGAVGEIGIAGVCLARGYINRDDLTERAFVHDFVGLPGNPSGRIYRTGDLGRIDEQGEIEYLGRIDTQVKIRGYRIELTEIESVMLGVPGVQQAVVTTHEREPGLTELVGYYTTRDGVEGVPHGALAREIRTHLPPYMVPAFFEELPVLPTLACDKVDRKRLPPPRFPRYVGEPAEVVAPADETEAELASSLAELMGLEEVSVEAHFFDDLGANSLLLAQLCTRVRERLGLNVSMKDMYLHPTVRSIAAYARSRAPQPATAPRSRAAAPPAGLRQYALCGALQLLFFVAYTLIGAAVFVEAYDWIAEGSGLVRLYVRSMVFGIGAFVLLSAIPVALKWSLVGRWKEGPIAIWGPAYVRFWMIRQSLRMSPMLLLAGSPLYNLYLRALGARVGRNAVILTTSLPVCTDLVTIGDDTVIRRNASLLGYRARAGWIETGPVTIGNRVIVGEASVLDIGSELEDDARLAHASSLHEGQVVPAGRTYHGSPAEESGYEFPVVSPKRCGRARRAWYSCAQLIGRFAVEGPLLVAGVAVFTVVDASAVGGSLLLYAGGLAVGLLVVATVPRALGRLIEPGRVYPLYGFHYSVAQTITRTGNSRFFNNLFGDSSYVVRYLRGVGVDLAAGAQTGSNFGLFQTFELPSSCHIGPGTMVSDGLSMMNVDLSSSSFTTSHTSIGARNFLGNEIHYPPQGRTGDNCLLATKVMVPITGPVREGVGLLGSPPFEIPRSVRRDAQFDHLRTGAAIGERLARKNRVNLGTMALYLVSRWIYFYACVWIAVGLLGLHQGGEILHVAAAAAALVLFTMAYFVLVERLSLGFRRLSPQYCSIYDPYYWHHERYWKLNDASYLAPLNGTPFKGPAWRLLGARVGRRLFDDGCAMPEKTLVTIGDDCTLGERTTLQCHSLEDGTFKSDHIVIGSGCTIGTNAFVHYGVVIGDGVVLAPDAFLMKGERPRAGSAWGGNPARAAQG